MPSKFIWDNMPGIQLFDILGLSGKHLVYSCFNYNPGAPGANLELDQAGAFAKRIYYTGERFLDDINADIVIGFLPGPEVTKDKSYPIQVINVLQGYTNTPMTIIPASSIVTKNRQFIVIRDQERGMLEYLYGQGSWKPGQVCSIYADLALSWSSVKAGLKTRFCCFIVSNPGCWQRNNFFDILSRYKRVDSLGKYKRRLPADIITVPERSDQDAYFQLLAQYKFMITFENNSLAWYNTEKVFNAFQAGTVPIYWGDPLIDQVYNPASFIWIKAHDDMKAQFEEFRLAIELIKELDEDTNKYAKLFQVPVMVDAGAEDARLRASISRIINLV